MSDRVVGARVVAQLQGTADLELQVAVAQPREDESLVIALDGEPLVPREVQAEHGGRLHLLRAGPGRLEVDYSARVVGRAGPVPVEELDASRYLRPSRYAESDRLAGLAETEFGHLRDPAELLPAVAPSVDTLLTGQGVCRDYAHLTVGLLRARDVPARLVSAYAPGLDPMDFHAVAEGLVDGAWQVVDATLLAPRSALVRIATGRDAADTSWLSNYGGVLDLQEIAVSAWVDGDLPGDDLRDLVALG